jgi:hypothetical protein
LTQATVIVATWLTAPAEYVNASAPQKSAFGV